MYIGEECACFSILNNTNNCISTSFIEGIVDCRAKTNLCIEYIFVGIAFVASSVCFVFFKVSEIALYNPNVINLTGVITVCKVIILPPRDVGVYECFANKCSSFNL